MNERDRLFLNRLLSAIAEIENFTTAGQSGFMADRKTQSAVVRQLEIIGEAVKNLSKALTICRQGTLAANRGNTRPLDSRLLSRGP